MSGFALEAIGLHKAFGGLAVTRDVTLRLKPGDRHALIGPNGAGKTTLVGLLSGLITVDAGKVLIFGRDVTGTTRARRVREGMVRTFQVTNLFTGLSALENVFLAVSERAGGSFRLWRSAYGEKEMIGRARAIIEQVGLGEAAATRVDALAYGQQRLLEIAVALALEPKILLLDEPTAGIPSSEAGILLEVLDRLPSDIAILLIEHDMQVVRRFATEVTVLVEGHPLITGSPLEVMASEEVRSVYLGQSGHNRFMAEALNA